MRRRRDEKMLRAVRANAGIRAAYQRKLDALIAEMARSYVYFLKAQYRQNPPVMAQDSVTFVPGIHPSDKGVWMAQDASPAAELQRELRKLGARWQKNIDEAAPKLAAYFALSVSRRSDAALRKILRDAGISVKFQMTRAMRDILNATIAENVSLIKSIPSQYHTQVEGLVMRAAANGRDLHFLSTELQKRYGITRRRAAFISLDQSNKSTSAMMVARQTGLGIEEGIWLHSHAGKVPRPSHVAQDGKKFNIKNGWRDPAINKIIWPGTEPGCRCSWRVLVKGFS